MHRQVYQSYTVCTLEEKNPRTNCLKKFSYEVSA